MIPFNESDKMSHAKLFIVVDRLLHFSENQYTVDITYEVTSEKISQHTIINLNTYWSTGQLFTAYRSHKIVFWFCVTEHENVRTVPSFYSTISFPVFLNFPNESLLCTKHLRIEHLYTSITIIDSSTL